MGFAAYFLIVADFINWAKDHDIPLDLGVGRQLVAWLLTLWESPTCAPALWIAVRTLPES